MEQLEQLEPHEQLTVENVQSLPLPPHGDTEWPEYYRAWRERRRLLDAMQVADELGVSYADIRLSQPLNCLQLVYSIRQRISAARKKAAAQRYNEKRRKAKAATAQEVA